MRWRLGDGGGGWGRVADTERGLFRGSRVFGVVFMERKFIFRVIGRYS